MNLPKILDLKKIKEPLADFFEKRSFWCLLFLATLLFSYATFLFVFYVFKNPSPSQENSNLQIKTPIYQAVIPRLEQKETNIQQGTGQNYLDIFR